jgi:hypothetical protein
MRFSCPSNPLALRNQSTRILHCNTRGVLMSLVGRGSRADHLQRSLAGRLYPYIAVVVAAVPKMSAICQFRS